MSKRQTTRRRVRKALIWGMFLLFPLLLDFFSPYIIIDGASRGIVNGSMLVFAAMLLASLFLGRACCGWLCPAAGRRAFCHYGCWMAPFMIIGRKIRNLARWPALRLKVEADLCVQCNLCSKNYPMSLDVERLVLAGAMEHNECILCGTCVDVCPKDAIRYSFSKGNK